MERDDLTAVVADDHELFRVALADLLRRHHGAGSVIEVASLDEAVERLGEVPEARVALFDLQMPGMAGTGSLEAVRRVFPDLKVLVVSGSERREDILGALSAGAHGYVPKSLRLTSISAAIRQVLDGAIYVPPSLAELPPASAAVPTREALEGSAGLSDLTQRQREVLALLREGRSNKEIARALRLSAGTVKVHVAAVLRAFGASSRAGAVAAAVGREGGSIGRST